MQTNQTWADLARQILRQYNECLPGPHYEFRGPHYVTYNQGKFILRPYGWRPDHRYSFECRWDIVPWQEEPLWIFMVMC